MLNQTLGASEKERKKKAFEILFFENTLYELLFLIFDPNPMGVEAWWSQCLSVRYWTVISYITS